MVWCVYTGTADPDLHWRHQKLIFVYPCRPLLDNVSIYTFTLILHNSLSYNLTDSKLGTMVCLFILYHPLKTLVSLLYGIVLLVDM